MCEAQAGGRARLVALAVALDDRLIVEEVERDDLLVDDSLDGATRQLAGRLDARLCTAEPIAAQRVCVHALATHCGRMEPGARGGADHTLKPLRP